MIEDRKAIRIKILDQFRSLGDEDDCVIPREWIEREYFRNTDIAGRETFQNALQDLSAKGLIEALGHPVPEVKLTEKGVNLIF